MSGGGAARGESGNATLELALGTAVLVVPVLLLVTVIPLWLERHAVAELAAREAARAFALADDAGRARHAAHQAALRVAAGHGIPREEWATSVSGVLSPGATVTARVSARVPSLVLPLLGAVGGFTVTAEHRELVDPYRSW